MDVASPVIPIPSAAEMQAPLRTSVDIATPSRRETTKAANALTAAINAQSDKSHRKRSRYRHPLFGWALILAGLLLCMSVLGTDGFIRVVGKLQWPGDLTDALRLVLYLVGYSPVVLLVAFMCWRRLSWTRPAEFGSLSWDATQLRLISGGQSTQIPFARIRLFRETKRAFVLRTVENENPIVITKHGLSSDSVDQIRQVFDANVIPVARQVQTGRERGFAVLTAGDEPGDEQ